jgi:hypothetical protein
MAILRNEAGFRRDIDIAADGSTSRGENAQQLPLARPLDAGQADDFSPADFEIRVPQERHASLIDQLCVFERNDNVVVTDCLRFGCCGGWLLSKERRS